MYCCYLCSWRQEVIRNSNHLWRRLSCFNKHSLTAVTLLIFVIIFITTKVIMIIIIVTISVILDVIMVVVIAKADVRVFPNVILIDAVNLFLMFNLLSWAIRNVVFFDI
jgi:hypothetical protein